MNINNFHHLSEWLKALPYKRISDTTQLYLVMKEGCGTCSSKHALFSAVAIENNLVEFRLMIGMYKMNSLNTPGIGNVIEVHDLEYIPEAHCYLRFEEIVIDVTKAESIYDLIKADVIGEKSMSPSEAINSKKDYHKSYIKRWKAEHNISYTERELWAIREQCIKNLILYSEEKKGPL